MYEFNTKESVNTLVPHSGKMSLLDRVKEYDLPGLYIDTEVDINKSAMLYDEELHGIPVWVGFEYMAQSISALSGIYGLSINEKPKVGFIMSINSYKAEFPIFPEGSTLLIHVQQMMRMDMAVTFDGKIFIGDKLYATATLNTVEVPDLKKALGL